MNVDSSFNNYENEIDNIRPPDEIKREQLLETIYDEWSINNDKELEDAIYLSLYELNEIQKQNKAYEDKIVNEFIKETNERREKFRELLDQMNKIGKYDKDVKEIYEIIETIIEAYCNRSIDVCELDRETYNKIFSVINTIRNGKEKIKLLTTLLVEQDMG